MQDGFADATTMECDFSSHALDDTSAPSFVDPLEADLASDRVFQTTRRGLARLALIAAETATRFERDGIEHEPMAWLMAPRRMFGGASAVDACLDRAECVRALVLHRVGAALDGDPAELDELADGWDEDDGRADDALLESIQDERPMPAVPETAPALFTTTAVEESVDGLIHVFEAVLAGSQGEAEALFRSRHGGVAEGACTIRGFRPDLPLVSSLVSPTMAFMLEQIDRYPASPLARGVHVTVEQRFAA